MKVKIKRLHEDAVIPKKAHLTDAGFDLVATSRVFGADGTATYGTGLAFEIPKGYVGLLFPRSSVYKQDQMLCNHVGVLDSGYRGEVTFKFKPTLAYADVRDGRLPFPLRAYEVGERIGQIIIVPYPEIEYELADELQPSDRGTTGYGGSGR